MWEQERKYTLMQFLIITIDMRTYKYKTVEALIKQNHLNLNWALSIEQIVRGTIWSASKEAQIKFVFPDKEYRRIADMIVDTLEFRGNAKDDMSDKLKWAMAQHRYLGLPERLYIEVHSGTANVSYCAGQDYIAEVRYIRNHLKNA